MREEEKEASRTEIRNYRPAATWAKREKNERHFPHNLSNFAATRIIIIRGFLKNPLYTAPYEPLYFERLFLLVQEVQKKIWVIFVQTGLFRKTAVAISLTDYVPARSGRAND